jgi:hypoxanthine-DNA glycosylase
MLPVHGFPPIADRDARVLVLGSMPGAASLRARQYYAHPHNAFWPIVGSLCGAVPDLPYAARCAQLRLHGIALWDVLTRCVRPGSLDADIDPATIVTNDFAAFFARHPRIEAVFCNGGTAFACYRRHVLPVLRDAARALAVVRLPSTSPAHAGMRLADKRRRWLRALRPFVAAAVAARAGHGGR